jgi:hypothetical protein
MAPIEKHRTTIVGTTPYALQRDPRWWVDRFGGAGVFPVNESGRSVPVVYPPVLCPFVIGGVSQPIRTIANSRSRDVSVPR